MPSTGLGIAGRWPRAAALSLLLTFGIEGARGQVSAQADASRPATREAGPQASTPLPATGSVAPVWPALAVVEESDGPLLFFDDFSWPRLDTRRWSSASCASVIERAAGPAGVRLGVVHAEDHRPVELRSVAIDLGGVAQPSVTVQAQPDGYACRERLLIEYWATNEAWKPLDALPTSADFRFRTLALPADALHVEFRLRLRVLSDAPADAWNVASLQVRGGANTVSRSVRIQSFPDEGAAIVLNASPLVAKDVITPAACRLPENRSVRLNAAAEALGGAFEQWLVDGVSQPRGQRWVDLPPRADVVALAIYSSRRENLAEVAVRSTPLTGIPVEIGIGGEVVDQVETDAAVSSLLDETLLLSCPQRVDRSVLQHWTIDGVPQAPGRNALSFPVRRGSRCTGVYALLGDMNDDGRLDREDVDLFILALGKPPAYAARFPELDPKLRGDINNDGTFDEDDIADFVQLMMAE